MGKGVIPDEIDLSLSHDQSAYHQRKKALISQGFFTSPDCSGLSNGGGAGT
jgi:hypothetical protein